MTSDLTSSLSQKRDHTGANIKLEILGIINRTPIWDLDISSLSKKTGTYGARIPSPPYIKKYSSLKRRGSNTTFVIVNEGRFSRTLTMNSPRLRTYTRHLRRWGYPPRIQYLVNLISNHFLACSVSYADVLVLRQVPHSLEEVREGNHQIILQGRGGIPDPRSHSQTIWWLQIHVPIFKLLVLKIKDLQNNFQHYVMPKTKLI